MAINKYKSDLNFNAISILKLLKSEKLIYKCEYRFKNNSYGYYTHPLVVISVF